jgi:hypothetical protein
VVPEDGEGLNADVTTNAELTDMRRDQPLDEAFHSATGGTITTPNVLQHALFPRFLTQDTGLLLPTGPGAGRLEAVFVPTIATRADSSRYGLPRQRLFIIAADGCPLDDYYERLGGYLREVAAASGIGRTIYIASEEESVLCERYMPDGSLVENASSHPLDPAVDLAVAPFGHFRSLFFGAGGVHALPQSLLSSNDDFDMRPRDLFYFDEAMGYGGEEFSAFLRLVEFLFTQDLDIVMGTTTLPRELQEELAFLETLSVPEAQTEPEKMLQSLIAGPTQRLDAIEKLVNRYAGEDRRVLVCMDQPEDIRTLYQRFTSADHQSKYSGVYRYERTMPRTERASVYSKLRSLDREDSPYLLIVDGPALEAADLSADMLISTVAAPEALLRRAGRANRRGRQADAKIVIVGDGYPTWARALPKERRQAYWNALESAQAERPFRAQEWKDFIA